MAEKFTFPAPEAEKQKTDEILENGWQKRLRSALDRNGNLTEEIESFKRILRKAEKEGNSVLIIDGLHRDAILLAEAVREHLAEQSDQAEQKISFASQTVDNVISAAYGMSALTDPNHEIGRTVGYATGQGKELNPGAQIVASTTGSLARLVLNEKVKADNVGAVIIDGGDDNNVYNQLLISAIKEQQDRKIAPLTIIVSRRVDKKAALAAFFEVSPSQWTGSYGYSVRESQTPSLEQPLPEHISYEDAEEPFHIKQAERSAEILNGILRNDLHPNANTIVFVRDEEMLQDILLHIDKKFARRFMSDGANEPIETDTHTIQIISERMTLKNRLAIELGSKTAGSLRRGEKPRIVMSTLPVEMLGVVEKFGVVIDTHRSKEKGGYYSISREEADRRASFAGSDGVCYRLTTESEYENPQYLAYGDLTDEFSLSQTNQERFEADLRVAGKDPETFPMIAPRSESDRRPSAESETAEADPAIEQWIKTLNVDRPVAKLVDALDKKGERELALAVAACIRETRIFLEGERYYNLEEYLEKRGAVFSDVSLRLNALADYIKPNYDQTASEHDIPNYESEMPAFNQQALSHMKAMIDRWGAALGKKVDAAELAEKIRGLNGDTLTKAIIEAMPERFAFFAFSYIDKEYKYADERQISYGHKRAGRSTRFMYQSPLLFVIGTAGKSDEFITTSHPVSIEQALRLMPERVRMDHEEAFLDKQTGKVMKESRLMVLVNHEYAPFGREKDEWVAVEETTEEVEGEAAQTVLDAEQKRKVEVANLKETTEARLRLPLRILRSILDHIDVGAVKTSAQDRLNALQAIQKQLAEDSVANPKEIEKAIDSHIEKLDLLSKKAAKENAWEPEWYLALRRTLSDVPEALSQHEFAQELIDAGASAEDIESRINDYILDKGIDRAQKGETLDLESIINIVLDSLPD